MKQTSTPIHTTFGLFMSRLHQKADGAGCKNRRAEKGPNARNVRQFSNVPVGARWNGNLDGFYLLKLSFQQRDVVSKPICGFGIIEDSGQFAQSRNSSFRLFALAGHEQTIDQ
jgi:hypothetical protein